METSEKVKDGRYLLDHIVTSTVAVIPYYDPKYVIMTMLDDPSTADGEEYKTAAWNSGKVLGEILKSFPTFGTLPVAQTNRIPLMALDNKPITSSASSALSEAGPSSHLDETDPWCHPA